MISIDLHVHTSRYSFCSHISPEELIRLAPERGIDGIVITEHDWQWSGEEIANLQESIEGVKLYTGLEASLKEGHFLVIGLEHQGSFDTSISLRELSARARKENAAMIWAHPGRFGGRTVKPGLIDAMEVMSFNIKERQISIIEENRRRLHVPGVAASDSHRPISLGTYATRFPRLPSDEKEMARMIISSSGVPWANAGALVRINSSIDDSDEKYLVTSPA